MKLVTVLLAFTLYIPMLSTGRPVVNEVAAPVTGAYKFLKADDWFQVICASGDIEVVDVGGYALVRCIGG